MNEVVKMLNSKDISPSFNRVSILKYLLNTTSHPTVDEIYSEIKKYKTNLSKMTIYNVLDLLTKKDLVRTVYISEKEVRYDANVSDHAHFRCKECNSVIDIDIDFADIRPVGIENYEVDQRDIFFYGVCENCMKKKHTN